MSVCCVFAEITKKEIIDWSVRSHPAREMVRMAADREFRKRDIDVLALFTFDDRKVVCLDLIQSVYADDHLEKEFEEFETVFRQ